MDDMRWMFSTLLVVLLGTSVIKGSFRTPQQGFFTIVNPPLICPDEEKDTYIYALHTSLVQTGEEVRFERNNIFDLNYVDAQSGVIENDDGDAEVGCFLHLKANPRNPLSYVGSYTAVFSSPGQSSISRNSFVRPHSLFLKTGRVYTITVYPGAVGSDFLSEPLSFGVNYTPGCRRYRWFQGKRKLTNTDARLILTKIERAAGIYSISRGTRRGKGWFVQIEIIVASCPIDYYYDTNTQSCTMRNTGTGPYPICLDFGGVPRDQEDSCICPPFRFDPDCSFYDCDATDNPAPLVNERTGGVQCSSLPGGNDKCEGHLICYGDLYGCKCSSGWFGAGCDYACPDGKWGPDCLLTCPSHDPSCDPLCGPMNGGSIIMM